MTRPAYFSDVSDRLEALGAHPGIDFVIDAIHVGQRSSEHYGLRPADGDQVEVYYRDMGRSRSQLVTTDTDHARDVLVDLVLDLAGGRGRGERAKDPAGLHPDLTRPFGTPPSQAGR